MKDQRPVQPFHPTLFSRLPLRLDGTHMCPYCNSHAICREKRHGIIQRVVCSALGMRPYLCIDCDHIYYARSRSRSRN